MKYPPWIDPKTGTYKNNKSIKVPGLNKLISEITPDEFANAVLYPPKKYIKEWQNFFNEIGWPEGFHYCTTNYKYARDTGYKCILKN